MIRARVYKSSKREFECKVLDTEEFVSATALGNLLKRNETIVVGDFVSLEKTSDGNGYEIHQVDERKNEIFRIVVREQKKKVTASNCDLLVIFTSVSKPAYKQGIIDRFLLRSGQWNVPGIIIFNKMDEYSTQDFDIKFESDRLKEMGVKCFEVCALDSSYKPRFLELGMNELKQELKDKTSLFLGQSGVGKSKLISYLSEGKVDLRVNKVNRSGKGSHTTTWSEIIDCTEFSLIDSPGIRSFSVEDLLDEELISLFPDVEERSLKCKFNDCQHEKGTKGCFFLNLDPEVYDDELILSRLHSYMRILEEVKEKPFWNKSYK